MVVGKVPVFVMMVVMVMMVVVIPHLRPQTSCLH